MSNPCKSSTGLGLVFSLELCVSSRFVCCLIAQGYHSHVFKIANFGYNMNMIINANVHVKVQRYFMFCNQHVMSFIVKKNKFYCKFYVILLYFMFQPVVNIILFLVNLFVKIND